MHDKLLYTATRNVFRSRDLFTFLEISDNILETAQDKRHSDNGRL